MEQTILKISENKNIAKNVYKMVLEGDIEEHLPGRFVNIKVPGTYLRRPISVCDYEPGALTICYKAVGEGTGILSGLKAGEELDVLTGLGNGYDISSPGDAPLLIGGGMGAAPLFYLAKVLMKKYTSLEVIIGFNAENEIFYREEFENLGCELKISTVDGSVGAKGFVTDILPKKYSSFFSCGPMPMMKAVNRAVNTPGQFSFEERMGCGFGACMGCSMKVKDGYKRICKDGPVFKREEIIWED